MMKIIDLSVAIENDVPADPPGLGPKITYTNHAEGSEEVLRFFPGLDMADVPGGEGWAIEQLNLTAHAGTHLDAPWHFASTMNNGERAWTIDEVPLDWCIRPGVKLDLRHLPDGSIATAADLQSALAVAGHTLQPFDVVLVNTAAGAAYGRPDYLGRGCGIGREATHWLMAQGVHIAGTDAWSWDAPFPVTAKRFAETRDAGLIWEGHKAAREGIFLHMEKLTRLEELPGSGFTVSCLPVKIKGGSAGWCRAVAIFPDG
ncbi:cyclase family protein [Agrobacterium vitis]|uniref:Cyclase family protein n=1 Tax=Agrobacterium vitis TaxID=373 RepID=A0A368NZD4_AGRVI|nr:cyclase family protein [Agrobacterium vitis]KAA3518473.1 cyclase family protein [Agrobacterium vitis]KAA3530069.1 cyclase family protein [Agrobacterium vitis]MCF1476566.1 cyclase family protein [Agrobacterium vitis]MUZ96238.1 cyclase family protein [Agrobacterium vitis]MVA29347.1 cyclase family protein [Agrobacterium vitis]